jgi:hypothetical protein
MQNIIYSGVLFGILSLTLSTLIIISFYKKEIISKLANFATLGLVVITILIVYSHWSSPIILTKENIGPKTLFNSEQLQKINEKNKNYQLESGQTEAVNLTFNDYLLLSRDPAYENSKLGIKPLVETFYLGDELIGGDVLLKFFNENIKKYALNGVTIAPEMVGKNKIQTRFDLYNKYNICFFTLIQKLPENKSLVFKDDKIEIISSEKLQQCIDMAIANIRPDNLTGMNYNDNALLYTKFVNSLLIADILKSQLHNAIINTSLRENLVNKISKIHGIKDKDFTDPIFIETLTSQALGYKVHHVHNFVESYYRSNNSIWNLFVSPGQYGFGAILFSRIISKSDKAFDMSVRSAELCDLVILAAMLLIALFKRKSYLILVYCSSASLLLLYFVGGEYAPALHYVRILPQLILLITYITFEKNLSSNRLNAVFGFIVAFSSFYNFEFGIFTLIAYLSAIIISDRNILANYKKLIWMFLVSIPTLIMIAIKFTLGSSGARSFEYLFGIGLNISGFTAFNTLLLFLTFPPIIIGLFFRSQLLGININRYKYFVFFSLLANLISIKFHWNSSFNHLIVCIPIICISYSIFLQFNLKNWLARFIFIQYLILAFYITFIVTTHIGSYVNKITIQNTLINKLLLIPRAEFGDNVLVTKDINDLIGTLEKMDSGYPILSFQDSLASIYYKDKIFSYYNDFSTNIRNDKDLNLTHDYLIKNHNCIFIDKQLLLSVNEYMPTLPSDYVSISRAQGSISKERTLLMRLAKYLVANNFTKLSGENSLFYKYCTAETKN